MEHWLNGQSEGLKRLIKLLEIAKSLECSNEDNWLYNALVEFVKQPAGEKKTLEFLLGLSGCHGKRSAALQLKTMLRNYNLYQAFLSIRETHSCGAWIGAELLSREIKSFSALKLRRLQSGDRLVKNELEGYLLSAFSLDSNIPEDVGYLHRVCNSLDGVGCIKSCENAIKITSMKF